MDRIKSEQREPLAKKQVKDYFEHASIHGLSYITEDGRHIVERLLWIVLCIAGVVLSVVLVKPIYEAFRFNPTRTTVTSTNHPIWDVHFPAVTVCSNIKVVEDQLDAALSKDPWAKSYENITAAGVTDPAEMKAAVKATLKRYLFFSENQNIAGEDFSQVDTQIIDKYNQYIPKLLRDVMHRCKDMFLYCEWQGKKVDCTSNEFFTVGRTDSGFCCSFNLLRPAEQFDESDEAKDGDFDQNYSYDEEYWDDEFNSTTSTTTTAAPSGRRRKRQTTAAAKKKTRPKKLLRRINSASTHLGLKIVLNPALKHYIANEDLAANDYDGFKVLVHSSFSFPEVGSAGFAVEAGTAAYIAVGAALTDSTTSVLDMSISRRKCLKHDESTEVLERDYNFTTFKNYSREFCLLECRAKNIFATCGCLPYYYPEFGVAWGRDTNCDSAGLDCLFEYTQRLYALQLPTSDRNKYKNLNMSEGVDCNCPFSCTEIDYVPEVSAAGTKPASRTLARLDQMGVFDKFDPTERNETRLSTTIVNIFFKDLGITKFKRDALYDFFNFIAAMGGVIGFCLGFSLLSGAEFIYFFTLRMFVDWRKRAKSAPRDDGYDEDAISDGPAEYSPPASSRRNKNRW